MNYDVLLVLQIYLIKKNRTFFKEKCISIQFFKVMGLILFPILSLSVLNFYLKINVDFLLNIAKKIELKSCKNFL